MHIPKVSVVIPVYKVEPYLRRCVDSVLAQTLSDLEIILVDDGSPDRCPEICDEYASKYENIQAIHKQNGGLASARNAGMKVATGQYLFFLDSDDWLDADGLERLCLCAEKHQVDFVRYRLFRSGWPGLEPDSPCTFEPIRELRGGYYCKEDIINEVYPRLLATSQMTMGAVVGATGSLYHLDFLRKNDLYFYEDVKFSEDLIFSARVVRAADSFYYIEQPGIYHYFYNPASISKSFRSGRWDSCKELISLCIRDFAADTNYDFSGQLHVLQWFCVMLALNERHHLSKRSDRCRYCKKIMQDPVVRSLRMDFSEMDISWKLKIQMVFIKLGFAWAFVWM